MLRAKRLIGLIFSFLWMSNCIAYQKEENIIENGRMDFNTHCSPCHAFGKEIVGPSLASVTEKRDEKWLFKFIRNSQNLIVAGDSQANLLYRNFKFNVMPSFDYLQEEEIAGILAYIKHESINPPPDSEYAAAVIDGEEKITSKGKNIFQSQCAHCHYFEMQLVGPALGSVAKTRPIPWLLKFIHSPEKTIASGDKYANDLYKKYNFIMPGFEYLSEQDVLEIIDYIKIASESPTHIEGVNGTKTSLTKASVPVSIKDKNPYSTTERNVNKDKQFFKILYSGGTTLALIILAVLIINMFKAMRQKKVKEGVEG